MFEKTRKHGKYGMEGIKETAQAEATSPQMPYLSMFQCPSVTGTNVTVMLLHKMNPGHSAGRCRLINKAVFHTRAETMPDLT